MAAFLFMGPASGIAQSANALLNLDHGWQFRQTAGAGESAPANSEWLPATVPGDVHLYLLANKKIPDPFYRDDEAKLQWIEQASLEYQDTFDVPAGLAGKANIDLVFDGLDAAAEVYLNDAHILSADNMFRIWRVPVKDRLHAGKQLSPVERLGDEIIGAQAQCLDPSLRQRDAGKDDHGGVVARNAHAPHHLEPFNVRKDKVEQDDVIFIVPQEFQRLLAAIGLVNDCSCRFEHERDAPRCHQVIFYQ